MGWNVYKFNDKKNKSEEMDEFEDALDMVMEGSDMLCELAKEMKELYGERRGSMSRKQHDSEDEDSFSGILQKRMMKRRGGSY